MKKNSVLFYGIILALSLTACSRTNFNQLANTSATRAKPISAKSFLMMDDSKQKKVTDQFKKKCDEPEILSKVEDDRYLNDTNKDTDYCFEICKLRTQDPISSVNQTTLSTLQTAVGLKDLPKYVVLEDDDGADDFIGDCKIIPPCIPDTPGDPIPVGMNAVSNKNNLCTDPQIYGGQPGHEAESN